MDKLVFFSMPENDLRSLVVDCVNAVFSNKIDLFAKSEQHQQPPEESPYLHSINEISSFLQCCNATSQSIKNEYSNIFIQYGRKFLVKKSDLLEALSKKKGAVKC